MIEIKNLYLKYIREYYALYDINLTVNDGDCVAFIGNEQSGRTTLLRVIAGLEKFESGEVYINQRDIKRIDFKCDVSLGYLPVVPVFLENKTVYENLKYVLAQRKLPKTEIEEKINSALINFNLEKYKNIKVKDLDIYEKYIVSFVRLTLRNLDYLLVDNVFEKLSIEEASALIQLINDYFISKKVTTIVVAPNYDLVKSICKRCVNFNYGSIVENT